MNFLLIKKNIFILNFLVVFTFFAVSSCSYRVTRTYTKPPAVENAADCQTMIVKQKDLFGVDVDFMGSIRLDDAGFTTNCSEDKAYALLSQEACGLGANLVNITSEAPPNLGGSTCYRCVADFYNLDINEENLKIIEEPKRDLILYDPDNPLKLEDFTTELPESESKPYVFVSNIRLWSERISVWTGAYKEFSTEAAFYRDVSGIKASCANQEYLHHLRLLFDISFLYAKKLENYLNSGEAKTSNLMKVQRIVDDFVNQMETEQMDCQIETNLGRDKDAQARWDKKIAEEFKNAGIN